jgi:inorganic triphosphatase YgiF
METELKFALSPDARRLVERHAVLADPAAGAAATHTDRTTYYDTSDHALHAAGFSLRIRHCLDDGKYVQTVKAAITGSSLRRQEWQWTLSDDGLDLERLDEVPGLLAAMNGSADLQPVFCTEVRRRQQMLHRPDGSLVELALDDGVIVTSGQSESLSELEIELKAGSEQTLFGVGLDLVQAAPLSLQVESKADRGYRLQDCNGPKARKAQGVALDPEATVAACFARLAESVMEHLLSNQPAALRGDEAEGVHQMRVAVRRLRSLLVLFGPLLERRSCGRFEDELRHLGDCLGTARDWDVFLGETLPSAASDGVATGWIEALQAAAETKRHAAHQAAKKAIGAPSFARFAVAFQAWSRCKASALAHDGDRAMGGGGLPADLLDRLEHKLAKRLGDVDKRDAASLHAVRKSAKKLRYGVEYLDSLFGAEAGRYAKRCNRLQKKLGTLNDLETAERQIAELVGNGRLDLAPAAGALSNWCEARRPKCLKKALKACTTFAKRDPFW